MLKDEVKVLLQFPLRSRSSRGIIIKGTAPENIEHTAGDSDKTACITQETQMSSSEHSLESRDTKPSLACGLPKF